MSLVKIENLSQADIRAKLEADLTKASSAADTMTIYSAYINTLNDLEKSNNAQNSQYRSMKLEILSSAHQHHMDNLDLHQNILGLIDSRLKTYKPVTASQALTGYAEGWLDNPYGNWGYDSSVGKHYLRLFCQEEGGTMYMPNAAKLINMSVVLKDAQAAYIGTPGAVAIETEAADGGRVTTGTHNIKIYFSNRADRDKLILPLFSTEELVGETVYFVADGKFPSAGIAHAWASSASEPPTPTWLADAIGREVDP